MDRDPNEFMMMKEVCAERKISPNTFYRLVKQGIIPPGESVGQRSVRWRRRVIDASFASIKRRAA